MFFVERFSYLVQVQKDGRNYTGTETPVFCREVYYAVYLIYLEESTIRGFIVRKSL